MDPSKRFVTLVLAAGVLVLLLAILLGERMGDRVLVQASDSGAKNTLPVVTPVPPQTPAPYSADWKRSQALSAAPDPGFPDPRVPPRPLPTPIVATPRPKPSPTHTPDETMPDVDATSTPSPSLEPTATPAASPSPPPSPTPTP
jgi:hypothetical protein